MIILLSGDRRVGKSTACQKLIQMACRRGKSVGGFLSIALFDAQGEKEGIKLMDPRTGSEQLLASLQNQLSGPQIGAYHMSADALQWGANLALDALKNGMDLVLIDEIGPLELLRGEGFAEILPALYTVTDTNCLIVVRPELVNEFERRLGAAHVVRCVVTPDNRDDIPTLLALLLWGAVLTGESTLLRRLRSGARTPQS